MEARVREKTIKVFLIDDNRFFLESLTFILNLKKDMEVVGTTTRGGDALLKIKELTPDVVVVDMVLPDRDGLSLLAEIREQYDIPVIMLSMYEEYRNQAIRRGAFTYLVKGEGLDQLYHAIRKATVLDR
ncbi:MAG TPA: response regulator transcription factor [Atribacteraceae bacterium]|nr:response regulator transcription factor [Atribacteraceae bacterium]